MSRDDGFVVADVDSGYFDDAKMRDLWHALGDVDRMARAVCLHSATLLASWRQGCRVAVVRAIPLWLPADPDLVAALKVAKLLDRFGKIPADSWQTWFGTAYNRREVRRVSGRAGGLVSAQKRTLPGEHPRKRAQHRLTDAAPTLERTSSVPEPVRPSVPTVRPSVRSGARAREEAVQGTNGAKRGTGALLADMAALGLGVPEEVASRAMETAAEAPRDAVRPS